MTQPGREGKKAVDERDAKIVALEAELQQTRQDMRAFSYSVSHDLRAPLRAVEGFGRILAEDYQEALDEEGRRFLNNILNNAEAMSAMIEDLLTFYRLSEKQFAPTAIDMEQLTKDVLVSAKKPGAEPEVKMSKLPTISADPAQMRLAWEHLIENALKFTKRQTKPVIEFGSDLRDGQYVLWIKDNGIGFDMQYANKLFQVFQKLQKEPDFEGNGIGLAIADRVAKRHKGRIWAEAAPDKGATFYLAVPK